MSADNGVYILKTPARPIQHGLGFYINQHGKFEFRVAHCQAIDNIDYSDLYMPLLFADSEVFESKEQALEEARKIYDSLDICEYGICTIEKDVIFPNMTSEQAKIALDSFVIKENRLEIGKRVKIVRPANDGGFENFVGCEGHIQSFAENNAAVILDGGLLFIPVTCLEIATEPETIKNPFCCITDKHLEEFAGKTIAVNLQTGDIVQHANSRQELREIMKQNNPYLKYASITIWSE